MAISTRGLHSSISVIISKNNGMTRFKAVMVSDDAHRARMVRKELSAVVYFYDKIKTERIR